MYIAVTHALYGALVSVSVFVIIMNVDSCFQMALVLVIMTAIITYQYHVIMNVDDCFQMALVSISMIPTIRYCHHER